MNTPAIKDIGNKIKKSIDLADDKTIKMIYAMQPISELVRVGFFSK